MISNSTVSSSHHHASSISSSNVNTADTVWIIVNIFKLNLKNKLNKFIVFELIFKVASCLVFIMVTKKNKVLSY